jgi:energy-coupling factor transporter ATP-binding protein EcfA2
MSGDIILETEDLTKEFAGFVAVNGVSLRVQRGTIHALIGPNGAGKTTCFNLLTKFCSRRAAASPSRPRHHGAAADRDRAARPRALVSRFPPCFRISPCARTSASRLQRKPRWLVRFLEFEGCARRL